MYDKQACTETLKSLRQKLELASNKINLSSLQQKISLLNAEMQAANFWDDPLQAGKTSQEHKLIETKIADWQSILPELSQAIETVEQLSEEDYIVLENDFSILISKAKNLYLDTLLTQKYDHCSAILTVICGTGGKDAQDFTQMLARMYLRYAENQNFTATILAETPAEDVGLKNMTIQISGLNAYGYLKCEHGVHRLVRLSDFNSGNTRETSFAMVDVIPEIAQDQEVEIKTEDLRIDLFRASGAGGQHVNTTDSAVRITHLPTGIVVSSQSDRSQHKNKEQALKILSGKLAQQLIEQNVAAVESLRGVKTEMSWGNQIRSYVLHPYKMVKDHRTSFQSTNPDAVFDGALQDFIEAVLINNTEQI